MESLRLVSTGVRWEVKPFTWVTGGQVRRGEVT